MGAEGRSLAPSGGLPAARASLEDNGGSSQSHGLESQCHVAWTFQVLSERRKPDANEGALRRRDDEPRAEGDDRIRMLKNPAFTIEDTLPTDHSGPKDGGATSDREHW